MTNTDLKTQIDNAITNKTTASSITPTDVGNNCTAIVDYIDQQDALSVSTTGIQAITGSKQFTTISPNIPIDIFNDTLDTPALRITNVGGAVGLFLDNTAGGGLAVTNDDAFFPGVTINNNSNGLGLSLTTYEGIGMELVCNGNGNGLRMDNAYGIGIDLTMSANGDGMIITNNGGSGKALTLINSSGVSTDVFTYKKNTTTKVVINDAGNIKAEAFNLNALNIAPPTSSSAGVTGEIRWVNGFVYLCVATNTWQRAALTTF